MAKPQKTLWERVAESEGATFYTYEGKWSWRLAGRNGRCYDSREAAARAFLRWRRTGKERAVDAESPIVEIRG